MTDTTRFANFRHFLQRGVAALYAEGTAVARDADYILYYTPFEHENPEAELVIVGITPGPTSWTRPMPRRRSCCRAGCRTWQSWRS